MIQNYVSILALPCILLVLQACSAEAPASSLGTASKSVDASQATTPWRVPSFTTESSLVNDYGYSCTPGEDSGHLKLDKKLKSFKGTSASGKHSIYCEKFWNNKCGSDYDLISSYMVQL